VRTTGVGQLTNIISNDVNRFDRLKDTPYIITVPIQTLVVALVLWYYIGVSAIAGIVVLILAIPIQGKCFNLIPRNAGKGYERLCILNKTYCEQGTWPEVLGSGGLLLRIKRIDVFGSLQKFYPGFC